MSPSQTEYLQHILDEIEYLTKHSKNLSFDNFVDDKTERGRTAHNSSSNDTPFMIRINYSGRSTLLLHNEFVYL